MNSFNMRKLLTLLAVVIVGTLIIWGDFVNAAEDEDTKEILYINSYHEGYKWSDDIYSSFVASIDNSEFDFEITTFYLDSQRIYFESAVEEDEYYRHLKEVIALSNLYDELDMVVVSDDAALHFVVEFCDGLLDDVPIVYSGINNPDYIEQGISHPHGGIIEYSQIEENVELIKELRPDVNKVYYVVDNTMTGTSIRSQMEEVFKQYNDVEFERLDGDNFKEIAQQAATLSSDSVILFSVYYYDNEGQYFGYDECARMISSSSSVPVFGMWEFSLGYGIIGGKLLSGLQHGTVMGEMAKDYFAIGEEALITVNQNGNEYKFDYKQLQKHGIDLELLPKGSEIINYDPLNYKNILIIHSYNEEFQWTANIDKGINDKLSEYDGNVEVFTEYMDMKRVGDPLYFYNYQKIYEQRHYQRDFDLVITSDDDAFRFARSYLFERYNVPVVFCGVNYVEPDWLKEHVGFTGVQEAYDLSGTLDTIMKLQPEVTKIYAINDHSTTGINNRKNIEVIAKEYEGSLSFEYTEDMTMAELQQKVSSLSDDYAILLMTFNTDRSNNTYSYAKSIELLRDEAAVPMYGVWDFYLGDGIVGGYLTDGYAQGEEAGKQAMSILNGEDPKNIDIITTSPNHYAFDKVWMDYFDLSENNLPSEAVVINKDEGLRELYYTNPLLFNFIILVLIVSVFVILLLSHFLRSTVQLNERITHMANNDLMTDTYNRSKGISILEEWIASDELQGKFIQIFFVDLNNLKMVNDRFGHSEGDHFIITVTDGIKDIIGPKHILCRMGGDEFMVACYKDEPNHINDLTAMIKEKLQELTLKDKKDYPYAVSIGLYEDLIHKDMNVSEIIENADKEMYLDKQAYHKEGE